MIGQLIGKISFMAEDNIILNANGVGYLVYIPLNKLGTISIGQELSLFIETQVREDSITLFGFFSMEEKVIFNLLKTVQGVGAKVALAIVSNLKVADIAQAILLGEISVFKAITGIGDKVATRIIAELKDKINKLAIKFPTTNPNIVISVEDTGNLKMLETLSALEGLGYSKIVAKTALGNVLRACNIDEVTLEELIKKSLAYFMNNKLK